MFHLTSCERLGKIDGPPEPTQAQVINLLYFLSFIDAEADFTLGKRHQEICISALRIVSEL